MNALTGNLDLKCPQCDCLIPKAHVVSAAMSILRRSRTTHPGPPKVSHVCPECNQTIAGTVAFRRHVPQCRANKKGTMTSESAA